MAVYRTIVGNLGTVYFGTNGFEARKEYSVYVAKSKLSFGRVSNESVTLLKDDEIILEYLKQENENDASCSVVQ